MRFRTLSLLAPLFAAACSVAPTTPAPPSNPSQPATPPTTDGVDTKDLGPSMSAAQDEHGVTVFAALFSYGAAATLGAGDSLVATVGGVTLPLTRAPESDGSIHYTARFDGATAPAATIALQRQGRPSAVHNQAQFPEPFTVTAPPSFTREQGGFAFHVSPPIPVSVTVSGDCVASNDEIALNADASGAVFYGLQVFDFTRRDCVVNAFVRTRAQGAYDPIFASPASSFDVMQVRSFSIVLDPTKPPA